MGETSSNRWLLQQLLINGSALAVAVCVEQIEVIWSLVGSSVSILIAYVLPAAFFLKAKYGYVFGMHRRMSPLAVLLASIVLCICCTTVSVLCTVSPQSCS